MTADEAIAEARDMVAKNFTCEPCVVETLLAALDSEQKAHARTDRLLHGADADRRLLRGELQKEREKVRLLREALEDLYSDSKDSTIRAALLETEDAP